MIPFKEGEAMPELRSAQALVEKILSNEEIKKRIKSNPEKELPQLAQEVIRELPLPLQTDKVIYRIVVGSLGLTILLVVLGSIILTAMKIEAIPDILTAIGSAAVGALAGLLAPSPVRQKT
jgi:hypothetical protein